MRTLFFMLLNRILSSIVNSTFDVLDSLIIHFDAEVFSLHSYFKIL